MDYSFVRLPYTLWYNGKDKKIRMDLNSLIPDEHYENGKKYIGKIRNVQIISCNSLGNVMLPVKDNAPLGPEELTEVIYNEEKRYADIILKSYQEYNNKRANVSWEDLKPYLGSNSNSNEYVTTTLEDILSMLRNTDESIRHEFTNDIIEYMPIDVIENDNKDIVVQYMPNYVNTQREHITERRDLFTIPRRFLEITYKEILKNEITESIQPALDKKYYTKQEVDTLIDNLRKELKPDS